MGDQERQGNEGSCMKAIKGEDGQKGEASDTGERGELDERNIAVQGDAERVPGKASEDMSPQDFERHPSGRRDARGGKIVPGTEPDRAKRVMVVVARGGDDKHNPGPDGRIEGEVEAEIQAEVQVVEKVELEEEEEEEV